MDDLISRRDAVSRFSDLFMLELKGKRLPTWEEVYNAMQDVPPAQQEVTEEAVKDYCRKRCLTILTDEYFHKLISAQPIDVQKAYYRGKIDGLKECMSRVKKLNEEFENDK